MASPAARLARRTTRLRRPGARLSGKSQRRRRTKARARGNQIAMSWLVWRQHRWDAVSTAAIVVVFGGGLILLTVATASAIAAVSHACANVQQPPLLNGPCESLSTQYHDTFGKFETFFYLSALAFPVLAGVFVGAPLISREFEHGTHLLVWSQGITRRRWFLSVVGLTVVGT